MAAEEATQRGQLMPAVRRADFRHELLRRSLSGAIRSALHAHTAASAPDRNAQTIDFSVLSGRTLITLRAGFALNMTSCLVNGLMPLRALVAGLRTTVTFISPATLQMPGPVLPRSIERILPIVSKTDATCL